MLKSSIEGGIFGAAPAAAPLAPRRVHDNILAAGPVAPVKPGRAGVAPADSNVFGNGTWAEPDAAPKKADPTQMAVAGVLKPKQDEDMFVRHVAVDRNKSSLAGGVFGAGGQAAPPPPRASDNVFGSPEMAPVPNRGTPKQASMMAVNNIW